MRVQKITESLAENGIEIHIVARNRNLEATDESIDKNYFIHRLPLIKNKQLRNFLNFPFFFSPTWLQKVYQIVCKYKIDLIITRDLPLSLTGYFISRIVGIPCIMDMAENYPALMKSTWDYRGARLADYFLRNPYLLKWMEKIVIKKYDGVVVVSDYSRNRLIQEISNISKKIWVIRNTPVLEKTINRELNFKQQSFKSKSSLILLYTGYIEAHRGLSTIIQSLPVLKNHIPDIQLVVVGEGTYKERLKSLAMDLNVSENVIFLGWMPHHQIYGLINQSDICLVPHYVTAHTNTTVPNKIFDYMSQKKPVIATDARALSDIIQETNCGITYPDKSIDCFVEAVLSLRDRDKRNTLGLKGWEAVSQKYNWNIDKEHLLAILKKFDRN